VITNTHYVIWRLPEDCDREREEFQAGELLGMMTRDLRLVNYGLNWLPGPVLYAWVDVEAKLTRTAPSTIGEGR
jgi:hypothetical protein